MLFRLRDSCYIAFEMSPSSSRLIYLYQQKSSPFSSSENGDFFALVHLADGLTGEVAFHAGDIDARLFAFFLRASIYLFIYTFHQSGVILSFFLTVEREKVINE